MIGFLLWFPFVVGQVVYSYIFQATAFCLPVTMVAIPRPAVVPTDLVRYAAIETLTWPKEAESKEVQSNLSP